MQDIEKISQQLFDIHYQSFLLWRSSDKYDESYKWRVLLDVEAQITPLGAANESNIAEIIQIYKQAQAGPGSFVHFTVISTIDQMIHSGKAEVIADMLNILWEGRINDAQKLYRGITGKTLGLPAVGYFLAGRNPRSNPLYRGEFWSGLQATFPELREASDLETAYKTYRKIVRSLAVKMETALKADGHQFEPVYGEYPAIDGQDFLYHIYFGWDTKRLLPILQKFVAQANQDTVDLTAKGYSFLYQGTQTKAGFGMGTRTKVPWFGFDVGKAGFGPTFLYYLEQNELILAYDHLEKDPPKYGWQNIEEYPTVVDYFAAQGKAEPYKFTQSRVFKAYDPHNLPESIVDDVLEIIRQYKEQLARHAASRDEQKSSITYWIFQGNPTVFDINSYLKNNVGKIISWSANQYAERMEPGDIVYFWKSGADNGGVIGIGTMTTRAYDRSTDDPELELGNQKVDIVVDHYFGDSDVEANRSLLLQNDILSQSDIIRRPQASNFILTTEQVFELQKLLAGHSTVRVWLFAPGKDNEYLDQVLNDGIISIGWDELGDLRQLANKEDVVRALHEKYHDRGENQFNTALACFDFVHTVKPGDIIILKSGTLGLYGIGHVVGDYFFDSHVAKHRHRRRVAISKSGEWRYDPNSPPRSTTIAQQLPLKTLTDTSQYRDLIQRIVYSMNSSEQHNNVTEAKNMRSNPSLNTILYGPPGTGKTYSALGVFARELLSSQAAQDMPADEVLAGRLTELKWWQVVALSLAQYDHPIKVSELRDSQLIQAYSRYVKERTDNLTPTLWASLQERSDEASSRSTYKRNGIEYFVKDHESRWTLSETGRSYVTEALSDINIHAQGQTGSDWTKYYRTITFHQSYSYEEFIEGIRPVLDDEAGAISYEIKDGIFKEMCTLAENDPENRYLLIIDEINRGNIAKIFGELITLLEPDKRIGGENELRVRLPYSKRQFGIPKNLYVLGTMNTADRSIALLDIALRRRFTFEELMPKPEILHTVADVDLKKLLSVLNRKIEVMLDRDHQIGHSYFMKVTTIEELYAAWYQKVIPLLQEYFYNDWDRLSQLIGAHRGSTGFVSYSSQAELIDLFGADSEYSDATLGSIYTYSDMNQLAEALKNLYESTKTNA